MNPDHLFLGTHLENMRDMAEKGRRAVLRGEEIGNSKLTREDVIYIRRSSETHAELARRFDMSPSYICRIRKGANWAHVSEGLERAS